MFNIKEVQAHCDIPCKIYDPATAQIATLSVIRLLDLIAELGDPLKSPADAAQLSRLVEQKETHAASVTHDVVTIWGDYFKEPQIEAFPDIHSIVHSIMLQGSKCKQSLSRENAEKLVSLVNEFSEIFWKTKEVDTSRVTAPYPPALEMVVPNLS